MIPEKQRYENLEKFTPDVVGRYDIPVIRADKVKFSDFIGFNYASTAKDKAEKAVHFFLDDYQFFQGMEQTEGLYKHAFTFCLCAVSRFFAVHRFSCGYADI